MTWIDKKAEMDTSGGWLRAPRERPRRRPAMEPVYTVAEVADILAISKQTVYKYLMAEDGDAVIPAEGWFKLPGSGHIRIRHAAVMALQG